MGFGFSFCIRSFVGSEVPLLIRDSQSMFNYEDLKDVFGAGGDVEYDGKAVKKIRENRAALEGELFIDKLLKALGLSKVHINYPPTNHSDLRALHQEIIDSSSPDHHKCSVLYYLVKDVLPKYGSTSQIPHHSANGSYLPPKYKTFIDGIWLLDRLRFEKALDYLTEPALTPTFPDDILYTLCKHTTGDDFSLPIAYHQCVSPPLASSLVLETYFAVLCRASVTEAFYFSRARGEEKHQVLFKKLIETVLDQPSGEGKASQGLELISLPLDEGEEKCFRESLTSANQSKLQGAADTLIMRDIALGRTEGLGDVAGMTQNRKIDGVNWWNLVKTLQRASG